MAKKPEETKTTKSIDDLKAEKAKITAAMEELAELCQLCYRMQDRLNNKSRKIESEISKIRFQDFDIDKVKASVRDIGKLAAED